MQAHGTKNAWEDRDCSDSEIRFRFLSRKKPISTLKSNAVENIETKARIFEEDIIQRKYRTLFVANVGSQALNFKGKY